MARKLAGGIALALLLALAVFMLRPAYTPAFRNAPNSLAEGHFLQLGGLEQRVWLRGADRTSPLLIILHGGPGTTETPVFRHYVPELERDFLVVYWDQRGTGQSFSPDIPPDTMTIARMLADLDELVSWLRGRFGERKVALLGHSWGTVLGTIYAARHPERVSVYAGTGQIANVPEAERRSYDYALTEARRRGHAEAIAELEAIGPPPHDVDAMLTSRKWVERFGGSFAGEMRTGSLIWAALQEAEVNGLDLIRFGRGNRFSLEQIWPELRALELDRTYTDFAVPVVFLLGRHDHQVPASVATSYFERISAPAKHLVWFEDSAHNPPFEQPERFVEVMRELVLPLARTGGENTRAAGQRR